MIKSNFLKIALSCLIIFSSALKGFCAISNKNYAGIEIDAKGVKFVILKHVDDNDFTNGFLQINDSIINTNMLNCSKQAGNETLDAVVFFYKKATNDFNIPSADIYISLSASLFSYAASINKLKVIEDLEANFKLRTNNEIVNWEVVPVEIEMEMSFKNIVSETLTDETILVNIGNATVSGGFLNKDSKDFNSFGFNVGCGILFKKMIKTLPSAFNETQFYEQLELEIDTFSNLCKTNDFFTKPLENKKETIVFGGEFSWALSYILMIQQSKSDFSITSKERLNDLRILLKNNFHNKRLTLDLFPQSIDNGELKAAINSRIHNILKDYDTKTLICGVELIYSFLNNIPNNCNPQNILFSQKGQFGWIPSYIGSKIIK